MKNWLRFFVVAIVFCGTVSGVAEDTEESAIENPSNMEEKVDESTDDTSTEASTSKQEDAPKETEKATEPVPTAPWVRLPVATKIPVNYDIDLPQDI